MRPVQDLRQAVQGWRRRFIGGKPVVSARDNDAVVDAELIRKLDRLTLQIGHDLISGLMGEHLASRRTTGIEFADYRQYSAGDDIRRVDWNAYARLGTLHIRQAQAEHDTVLFLLVDSSPSMDYGQPSKFLAARRLAASFGYIALSHLDAVVMTTPGSLPEPVGATDVSSANPQRPEGTRIANPQSNYRGRAESGSLFRDLQALTTRSVTDFDNILGGWSTARGQGRIAVVISDLLLDGYRDGIRQLRSSGFQVTVLHMLSPDELHPSDSGDYQLIDNETGAHMDVFLGKESLAEYGRQLSTFLQDSEAWCRSQGANYLLVRSDHDIERVMLDMLRRRGVTA
jgi:hypothetical protein